MRLVNETSLPAQLVRVARGPFETAAALVAKASFRLDTNGPSFDADQLPIYGAPTPFEGHHFDPDTILSKEGVDILVVGAAAAPDRQTRCMAVRAAIEGAEGSWSRELLVFGPRRWRRSRSRYLPSEPGRFDQIPVTWANAFGGVASFEGCSVPHLGNPSGRGYIGDLSPALEDMMLPNIEHPAHRLEQAGDDPPPVGFGPLPMTSTLRVLPAIDEASPAGVDRSILNVAPVDSRVPGLRGGERVELRGWACAGPRIFALPCVPLVAELRVGQKRSVLPLEIDTVLVAPSCSRLVLTYRSTFTYSFERGVPRSARLRWGNARAQGGLRVAV